MTTAALELLALQLERTTADCRRLAAENEALWRAYELSLGNPYQHLSAGADRWIKEQCNASDRLRDLRNARRAAGISIFREMDEWLVNRSLMLSRRSSRPVRPFLNATLRRLVHERDAYRCVACGTHLDLRVDHVVPLSKGGPTVLGNLQTLCDPHNRLKADRMPDDWAADLATIQREAGLR